MKRNILTVAVAATSCALLVPAAANGTPSAVSKSHTVFQNPSTHSSLVGSAQSGSAAFVKALGLSSDNAFKVRDVLKDADGSTHVRVDRTFKGVPVLGGDLVIHRDAEGSVTGVDGTFTDEITVSLSPRLTKGASQSKGLAGAKSYKGAKGLGGASVKGSRLVINVDGNKQELAYLVTTAGTQADRTPSNVQTIVSANDGAVLDAYDTVMHATGNGIFDKNVTFTTSGTSGNYLLKNPTTGNYTNDSGNTTGNGTTMTDADDVWGNGSNSDRASAGVDAQYGADATFSFLKNFLGRNGIWNNGQGARSRVHFDSGYVNAFWDGTQMSYGDGTNNASPLTEFDVAAHEMSHGVTQNTANLAYRGDAGGLNEATSDIFAAAAEFYTNIPGDTPDYLVGEMLKLGANGGPLRYMDKPSKDGRSRDCWSSSLSWLDPHYSSGPLNHWFYLASEGSGAKTINGVAYNSPTCNGSTVVGAGREAATKIWYRALSTKLTSRSNYKAAREASIRSAVELYGAGSAQCKATESAFNAISVPKGTATC